MTYQFNSSGSKKIDRILKIFDDQIKKQYAIILDQNEGDDIDEIKEYCISYWHKLLFIETQSLDTKDWKEIRKGDYWLKKDSLSNIQQLKFTLKKVMEYKNKQKQ